MRKRYSTALPVIATSSGLLALALLAGAFVAVGRADVSAASSRGGNDAAALNQDADPDKTSRARHHARQMLRMPYFSFARSLRPGG